MLNLPALRIVAALLLAALTSACRSAPTPTSPSTSVLGGSCLLNLPPGAGDLEAIRAVLQAEGEFIVSQDIAQLMQLWTEDGRVVDAKNTPDDDADNQNWDGKDAIRHRYVRTVFPGAPSSVRPADLDIQIDGNHAQVIATTQIGIEVSPAGDLWQLARVDGCWLIHSLTYNLETRQ